MKDYFSKTYQEAREKFLEKAKNLEIENIKLRDDLYIDVAVKKNKKNKKILILVSGTHGVEGFIGSAAQTLFLEEYQHQLKNTNICLIHALNPYGYKHLRRVNENNVDLNRNSTYDERLMLGIPNTKLTNAIADSLLYLKLNKPRKHRIIETLKYYALVFKTIAKNGLKNTINLGIEGQTTHPTSVGYRGIKLEDSLLYLRTIIETHTQNHEEAIYIDIHSGLGKKYTLNTYTTKTPKTKEFLRIKRIIKKIKPKNKNIVTHTGSTTELFYARTQAQKNTDILLEYGTVPKLTNQLVLNYLAKLNIEENQIFYYGNEKRRKKIQKKYKKAYAPNDKTYKKAFNRKTKKFYENLIQDLNK